MTVVTGRLVEQTETRRTTEILLLGKHIGTIHEYKGHPFADVTYLGVGRQVLPDEAGPATRSKILREINDAYVARGVCEPMKTWSAAPSSNFNNVRRAYPSGTVPSFNRSKRAQVVGRGGKRSYRTEAWWVQAA